MSIINVNAAENSSEMITVHNRMFSIGLPRDLKGAYKTKIKKDYILVYHDASRKAGFGGFAFGIKAYYDRSQYAVSPGTKKIGELTDKKGRLYDMVLIQPTDVQYDYTKGKIPDSFKRLYELGNSVNINGVKGSKYYKAQGTKGKDLYKNILKSYIDAVRKKRDSAWLEKHDMSYMYNVIAKTNKNALDKIGFAYYDVNADGIEELLIGEIADGEWKGVIYDIYTVVNRVPKHVVSGGSRDRYYVCNDVFVCNESSAGANESYMNVYALVENTTELYPQVGFKYDGFSKNPWYLSYNLRDDEWESVSEETFEERKSSFEKYKRFDYTPLSSIIIH